MATPRIQYARSPVGGAAGLLRERIVAGAARIDWRAILFAVPFAHVAIIQPLLNYDTDPPALAVDLSPDWYGRLFWPCYAAICMALAFANRRALRAILRAPQIRATGAFMLLALASVAWAAKPEFVITRWTGEFFVLAGLGCAIALTVRQSDTIRALYWTYSVAVVLNAVFVLAQAPHYAMGVEHGYPGYYGNKNILGITCSIAFLLALTQFRRSVLGVAIPLAILCLSIAITIASKSKGALVFALIAPAMAWLMLVLYRRFRVSPGWMLCFMVLAFYVGSKLHGDLIGRISLLMFNNPTLSNRTIIWEFVQNSSALRPLLGWGYRGFWLVTPDFFSQFPAEAWVKLMPHGHNGYLDVLVELGLAGFLILVVLIFSSVNAAVIVARSDPRRAWCLLSIGIYAFFMNLVESAWFRGTDAIWMIYLVLLFEGARDWTDRAARPDVAGRTGARPAWRRSAARPAPGKLSGISPARGGRSTS